MSWYYAKDGQQLGPLDDSAWDALVQNGNITPDTMVWKDGMGDWKPFREVNAAGSPVLTGTAADGICSQCGTRVAQDELIVLDGRPVCAACKPAALQKMKEGVSLGGGSLVYAGFWIRFAAKFVDGIIMFVIQAITGAVMIPLLAAAERGGESAQVISVVISTCVNLGIGAAYIIFFLGKFSATPGKMACRLKVVRPDGSPLTYGRAFGRWGAELLSGVTFGIGYLIAAFDDEKRALHDRVADTRVVRS